MMDENQAKRRGNKKGSNRQGKKLFSKNGGLHEYDVLVSMRLTDFVRQVLLPNTKFLQDGWHIYSDTVGTLSQVCLAYLEDVMGDNENNFQYWNNSLVSRLNYKFITAKSESGQRMKAVFEGEFIFFEVVC